MHFYNYYYKYSRTLLYLLLNKGLKKMDPDLDSIVAKCQFCYIAAIQLHDKHANLNNTFVKQAFKDDGDKSIDIIFYGAMFSPYKFNLQCEFNEDDRKFEPQRKGPRDSLNGNGVRLLI
ncbi:hypothetical protein HanHA89_Chr09g0336771 [Helianthus annuus]|nr:hypothetical protein HanHA89_Chr09g0336771 [Helianthus annuus]